VTKLSLVAAAIVLSACHVSNQLYNPADPHLLKPAAPPRSMVSIESNGNRIDRVDPTCDPADLRDATHRKVCMAFVEFDEQGEFWDSKQRDAALSLIERAKAAAGGSGGAPRGPLVVTFTHGWKNNADDRDGSENHNVVGFEGVLNYLQTRPQYKDTPIVGIYFGWRGALIPEYWPVRNQLSYFDREGTAIRIPGASMTGLLTQIMIETHRDAPAAHVVLVGHSFGALALERALTQAMTDYVIRQRAPERYGSDGAHADLVVFVNSAAAASEGKQMLNLLKDFEYSSQQPAAADAWRRPPSRPLFLSISSLGDIATRFAMPIGHGLSFLNFKAKGSWRDYGGAAEPPSVTAQSAYYLSTTAHMEALQSHVIVEVDESGNASATEAARCDIDPTTGEPRYFGPAFATTTAHRYRICEKRDRWNDTPYWAMQMPATIVPDHSGIFNINFLNLLETFSLDPGEMAVPGYRPTLKLRTTSK
jgi:hypothetical protein